jgi:hypothetical protein
MSLSKQRLGKMMLDQMTLDKMMLDPMTLDQTMLDQTTLDKTTLDKTMLDKKNVVTSKGNRGNKKIGTWVRVSLTSGKTVSGHEVVHDWVDRQKIWPGEQPPEETSRRTTSCRLQSVARSML